MLNTEITENNQLQIKLTVLMWTEKKSLGTESERKTESTKNITESIPSIKRIVGVEKDSE